MKLFIFDLDREKYHTGVVVVHASSLERARELIAEEFEDNETILQDLSEMPDSDVGEVFESQEHIEYHLN